MIVNEYRVRICKEKNKKTHKITMSIDEFGLFSTLTIKLSCLVELQLKISGFTC